MPELALWNNSVSNLRKPCGRRSFITRWSRLRRHARRTKTPSDGQSHSHFGHGIRPKAKERNVDGEASVHSLSLSPVSHSQKADQPLSNSFFPKKKKIFFCWYGFEFKRSRAVKPRGRQKAKLFFSPKPGKERRQPKTKLLRSSFNRPSVRCGPSTRLGRHLRSRFRCSMCSAVRMD